ncbi:hypothetical protein [Flavobacterium cerinum]|uniref:Organic solvent tolerance-like N-terminal domain-containing protein n=1 Tax=Flavobacterium cerinum TaxID=2502784 RepID=A0ABY5IYK4_9FLAO|nr:hypothetical protein [Flavobacterium cerinum]UUC46566.1 hypothetical protein NOX80_05035 [Flavobacterium cerinum]
MKWVVNRICFLVATVFFFFFFLFFCGGKCQVLNDEKGKEYELKNGYSVINRGENIKYDVEGEEFEVKCYFFNNEDFNLKFAQNSINKGRIVYNNEVELTVNNRINKIFNNDVFENVIIDYRNSVFYINEKLPKKLFIVSGPQNFTGKISNFYFYQIIDFNKNIVDECFLEEESPNEDMIKYSF